MLDEHKVFRDDLLYDDDVNLINLHDILNPSFNRSDQNVKIKILLKALYSER